MSARYIYKYKILCATRHYKQKSQRTGEVSTNERENASGKTGKIWGSPWEMISLSTSIFKRVNNNENVGRKLQQRA